jgi:hypothetical protein
MIGSREVLVPNQFLSACMALGDDVRKSELQSGSVVVLRPIINFVPGSRILRDIFTLCRNKLCVPYFITKKS